MAKFKNKVNYLGREGLIQSIDAPDIAFLYDTSLTKDPVHNIGDMVVLPGLRGTFIYCKSSAAITTNLAANFTAVGYTVQTVAAIANAIGDKYLNVPAATHAALTLDELAGGFVIIGNHGGTTCVQIRGIIGNTAADANAAFTIYLDAPLTAITVVSTTGIETYQNPFAAVGQGTNVALPKAGMAATNVSAANTYFWLQIKGITWTSSQPNVGGAKTVSACWRFDGSVDTVVKGVCNATGDNGGDALVSDLVAGFCIEGSTTGNGPLFVMK
jgi:hypothetical protein